MHPLGINDQVSCLVVTRGAYACSGEESYRKAPTRNIIECASSFVEFLRVITRMLFYFQGEGAHELYSYVVSVGTSSPASAHSRFAFRVREHPRLCRCEWSLEHIFAF